MADGTQGGGAEYGALYQEFGGAQIPASANGVLAVDLAALTRNYLKLRQLAAPAECAAVVKGNGYGLGAGVVGRTLFAQGCRTFFVATMSEAIALRTELAEPVIYVLSGLFPGSASEFAAHRLRPVLGDLAEVAEWTSFCGQRGERLSAALHVDTGMNRLGLKAADQQAVFDKPELLDGIELSLIISHLACADTPDHPQNEEQRQRFVAFASTVPTARMSLANSGGVFLGPDYAFDLVRPGIALYGGNPFDALPNPMEPVIRLYGRVAQISEAAAGECIGYGAARKLTRPTRYATVAVGYADGYFRALGSTDGQEGAVAYFNGMPLPILGRVSMDLIVFDITDLPEDSVQRGGFVELVGPQFTVDDAAKLAGTIGYEILTSLGPRYTRVYLNGETAG